MTLIELKNLSLGYDNIPILEDINMTIEENDFMCIVGPNGSGKSTLIKVLTGVHIPEEGEIYVDGKKVSFKSPNEATAEGIACVYQELNIVKLLSVTDNVFINKTLIKSI